MRQCFTLRLYLARPQPCTRASSPQTFEIGAVISVVKLGVQWVEGSLVHLMLSHELPCMIPEQVLWLLAPFCFVRLTFIWGKGPLGRLDSLLTYLLMCNWNYPRVWLMAMWNHVVATGGNLLSGVPWEQKAAPSVGSATSLQGSGGTAGTQIQSETM